MNSNSLCAISIFSFLLFQMCSVGEVEKRGLLMCEAENGEENQANSSCVCSLPAIVKRGFSLECENSTT